MSHEQHRAAAPEHLRAALVTVSDTRGRADDRSGDLIVARLEAAGHTLSSRALVPDEPADIEAALRAALADPGCHAVLLTGGTGISPRDRTADVVADFCDRLLPGFGELFRLLSFEEIGAAAMLSRALAGVGDGRLVVALPGSPAAVRLALDRLLLPELGHIIHELNKREGPRA